ncbi:MAG: CopD family protein [Acidiferrobacterales bacterium]|nr:CopD family protein [Acidiferrobacterales bacterium]
MLWTKTFHIVFVVTWFAGLFYLPRLFVYHAQTEDELSRERFKIMERKLYFGISTPSAVLALATGLALWLHYGFTGTWLFYKLLFVIVLVIYHLWCWKYLLDFKKGSNVRSHVFYRWFNEVPVVLLIAIVALVVLKPT